MKTPNKCIGCSVNNCDFHCKTENYCSLDAIKVGSGEMNPATSKYTECDSFKTSSY